MPSAVRRNCRDDNNFRHVHVYGAAIHMQQFASDGHGVWNRNGGFKPSGASQILQQARSMRGAGRVLLVVLSESSRVRWASWTARCHNRSGSDVTRDARERASTIGSEAYTSLPEGTRRRARVSER